MQSTSKTYTCPNCGSIVTGKYCSNCGQERITGKLKVKDIGKDVSHGIFHWDSTFFRTLKELVKHPGIFIRSYIDGKRKPYVKPFSYFIFIQTVYVILFHQLGKKYFAYINLTLNTSGTDLARTEHLQSLINANINYLNFILPLIYAFFLKLFLKKKAGVNYAEGIVFSFYAFGTILIFSVIIMLFSFIDIRLWNIRFIVTVVYLVFATAQFSGGISIKNLGRALLINIISYLVFVLLIGALTIIYIKYFMS